MCSICKKIDKHPCDCVVLSVSDGLLQHVFENIEGADTQVPNAFLVHLGLLKVSPVQWFKMFFVVVVLDYLYWFINIFVNTV